MAGQESDLLFNNLPPPYRALPNAKARIEDRRYEPAVPGDYAAQMSSKVTMAQPYAGDPMLDAPETVVDPYGYGLTLGQSQSGPHSPFQSQTPSPYLASYNRNFTPQSVPAWQPPVSPDLPPIPPHQIIAPGPAGWNPHGDAPMFTESPFTPQQMNSARQLWQTGQ